MHTRPKFLSHILFMLIYNSISNMANIRIVLPIMPICCQSPKHAKYTTIFLFHSSTTSRLICFHFVPHRAFLYNTDILRRTFYLCPCSSEYPFFCRGSIDRWHRSNKNFLTISNMLKFQSFNAIFVLNIHSS